MQNHFDLLVVDVMPIYMIMPRYSHNYALFYELLDSNLFTHRNNYAILREATSETYGPWVSFHHIYLCDLFSFAFIFRSIKPNIQKYLATIYLFRDLFILSTTFTSRYLPILTPYPKGIGNPFNTSGCEYLLFVCRCCTRSVAWFSYWFDNLGIVTKGNTYHSCVASSLPLWEILT